MTRAAPAQAAQGVAAGSTRRAIWTWAAVNKRSDSASACKAYGIRVSTVNGLNESSEVAGREGFLESVCLVGLGMILHACQRKHALELPTKANIGMARRKLGSWAKVQ